MNTALLMFDDKRLLVLALLAWTLISSSVFCVIMIKDGSNFLLFGPNSQNKLLGVSLDSWFKWWVTALYTFISTAIAAFAGDSLWPFITNTIQDHKTVYIPYSKPMCLAIIQIFTIYGVIMSVIGMFVALTQIDFMLIRIAADLVVNHYTTYWFLRGKQVDPTKYEQWKDRQNLTDIHWNNACDVQAENTDVTDVEMSIGKTFKNEKNSLLKTTQLPSPMEPNNDI